MAALTITAANVLYVSGPKLGDQVAGEAFAAGAYVYQADNGKWLKAQCDGTAVEAGASKQGIALATSDRDGSRISVAEPDAIVAIGTGAAGVPYFIGSTAGAIVPYADLTAPNKVALAAIGIGSNRVKVARAYDAGAVLA